MKKLVSLLLALVMIFSLAACGNNASNETNPPADNTDSPSNTDNAG